MSEYFDAVNDRKPCQSSIVSQEPDYPPSPFSPPSPPAPLYRIVDCECHHTHDYLSEIMKIHL